MTAERMTNDTTLLIEIDTLKEENAELNAIIQEMNMRIMELTGKLAAANAELEQLWTSMRADTSNQEIILRKIEKINQAINEKSATVETVPPGLAVNEAAAVRIARQDEIEQMKIEKQRLRALIGAK